MKTYYKNDLKKAYMILEGAEGGREDYQIIMLKENEIPGILNLDVRYIDNQSHYYYDISGKTSFKTLHEKIPLSLSDMRCLVNELMKAIQNVQRYMLDDKCILLDPEYIYCEQDTYFFCYYPFCGQDIKQEFHRLTEFFVREVDYKDEDGIRFAYTLHKSTMEENYSIEEIMKNITFEAQDEGEETPAIEEVDYTQCMQDMVSGDSLIEERDSMWESVRKFLERSKKRKGGYGSEHL